MCTNMHRSSRDVACRNNKTMCLLWHRRPFFPARTTKHLLESLLESSSLLSHVILPKYKVYQRSYVLLKASRQNSNQVITKTGREGQTCPSVHSTSTHFLLQVGFGLFSELAFSSFHTDPPKNGVKLENSSNLHGEFCKGA